MLGKTAGDWAGPLGTLFYTLELSTAGFQMALCEASDGNRFVLSDLGLAQSLVFPIWQFMRIAFFPKSLCRPILVNHRIQR